MEYSMYKYFGSIKVKKQVWLNFLSAIFCYLICVFFLKFTWTFSLIALIPLHLLFITQFWYKSKNSKVILTEEKCTFVDYQFFGVVKKIRQFDIVKNERTTLLNYFEYLSEEKEDIGTFSIECIDKTLNYKVVFENQNLTIIN